MVLFPGRNRLNFNPEEQRHEESFLLLLCIPHQGHPGAQGAARGAKAETHGLRIFPMFMKKGQNYSAFVEGKWGRESGVGCGFVMSHVPRAGKGTACVSWTVSCHPCLAKRSHPLQITNKVNTIYKTFLSNKLVLCNDSLAASQGTTTARCIPSQCRSSPGVNRSPRCSRSPKLHHSREAAKGRAICAVESAAWLQAAPNTLIYTPTSRCEIHRPQSARTLHHCEQLNKRMIQTRRSESSLVRNLLHGASAP